MVPKTTHMTEPTPRVHVFDFGNEPSAADPEFAGVVKRFQQAGAVILGLVENFGKDPFTFSVQESSDNGDSDAYSGINIRVDAASVASVEVAPGGKSVFIIEPVFGTTEAYLRFNTAKVNTGDPVPYGRVSLAHWFGTLEPRWRIGTP